MVKISHGIPDCHTWQLSRRGRWCAVLLGTRCCLLTAAELTAASPASELHTPSPPRLWPRLKFIPARSSQHAAKGSLTLGRERGHNTHHTQKFITIKVPNPILYFELDHDNMQKTHPIPDNIPH